MYSFNNTLDLHRNMRSFVVIVSLWQMKSKGSVWCNSRSHTTIYCNYTPARKIGADPRQSKWSAHNWTLLLNGLENSPATQSIYKCMSEEEAEREGRGRDKYRKSERRRESETWAHRQVRAGLIYGSKYLNPKHRMRLISNILLCGFVARM